MATSDTVLTGDSVSLLPDGRLEVDVQLPWYRSVWLSSVSTVEVSVDGVAIPEHELEVVLGEVSYSVGDLPHQWDVLWFVQDRLVVRLLPPTGAAGSGSSYDVEVTVELRLPYMQIAPQTYVTNRVTNRRRLTAA